MLQGEHIGQVIIARLGESAPCGVVVVLRIQQFEFVARAEFDVAPHGFDRSRAGVHRPARRADTLNAGHDAAKRGARLAFRYLRLAAS